MLVPHLMQSIRNDGKEADEAALTLGLLIERENLYHPSTGDDGGIRQILGEEFVNQHLSDEEIRNAVDELINYTHETTVPHARAIWALTKSHDVRILPDLINLLDRFANDPDQENLAYQALIGITTFYSEQSLAAIRRAAEQGQGEVKDTAIKYIKLFGDR